VDVPRRPRGQRVRRPHPTLTRSLPSAGRTTTPHLTGSAGPQGPAQLIVRDATRGDLDQHVAQHGLGIGHLFEHKPADAGWFVGADGVDRQSPFVWRCSSGGRGRHLTCPRASHVMTDRSQTWDDCRFPSSSLNRFPWTSTFPAADAGADARRGGGPWRRSRLRHLRSRVRNVRRSDRWRTGHRNEHAQARAYRTQIPGAGGKR
jgi:hypothetical protein